MLDESQQQGPHSIPRTSRNARPKTSESSQERMLHIRLDPDFHRALRVIVAEQDTTLQEWVVRTLEAAVREVSTRASINGTDAG
jgi:predicted HicB family RNase H-like nuclease